MHNLSGLSWLFDRGSADLFPSLALDTFRSVAAHLRRAPERLRLFVDARLLISAQATSERANALYGAAALDLPRRGVVHLTGGMGAISEKLVEAVCKHGGRVLYRLEVTRICSERSRHVAVETRGGHSFPADWVCANPTYANAAELLSDSLPDGRLSAPLRRLPPHPEDGWGAFVVFVGLDGAVIPLLCNIRPRLSPNFWLVGDSIFPGQSTPAVALGGLRVAETALAAIQ